MSTNAPSQPARSTEVESIVGRISEENLRRTVAALAGFGTRHTLSDQFGRVRGIGAARMWLRDQFRECASKSSGRMTVVFEDTLVPPSARIPRPTRIVNVIATLRPAAISGSDQTIVVCGHYDSRASDPLDSLSDAPGANDDASGTAVVLELARVLADQPVRATIIFAAFAGEEQGLFGSSAMAARASREHWNLIGVINNDIVGASHGGDGVNDTLSVRLFSQAYAPTDTGGRFRLMNTLGLEHDGPSDALSAYIRMAADSYVPGFTVHRVFRLDRFLRGGDHFPFHERGFPAVRLTEARENFLRQHQNVRVSGDTSYGDVASAIDAKYLWSVARVNAAAVASLAFAPSAPLDPVILNRSLEYTTTLRWRRNREPDLAGYRVWYRDTGTPLWQFSTFSRDSSVTLPVSKDQYLFGIQAVDSAGNPSPFAIPLPSR